MLNRLRLLLSSLVGATVVILAVCLGAQNLEDRPSLQLGPARSVPLPSGFWIGLALAAGVFSGGSVAALALGADPDGEDGPEGY